MRILLLGASGFVGRHVAEVALDNHEVITTTRHHMPSRANECYIDLEDKKTVTSALSRFQPQVVINCAGMVKIDAGVELNQVFTRNLLESIVEIGLEPKRIVISGSAAEYGQVDKLPVSETAPLKATAGYGLSKAKETTFALKFAQKHQLPVVIARLFNPLGPGMHDKFLIPGLIRQLKEIKAGNRRKLEVSRLDAHRDYINVADVAQGIKVLFENEPQEQVYNLGSGKSISTRELVDLLIRASGLETTPKIMETVAEPEPQIASQADIRRISQEFGWQPIHTIEETIKEIVDATGK